MSERITVNSKNPVSIKENLISHKRKTDFRSNSSPVNRILHLQRTIGNQAVSRLMRSGALQAKLKIGQPGHKYEQEADRVADAVMRMPEPGVQRQADEEEEELIQTKPLAEQITPLVQRQIEEEEKEALLQPKLETNAEYPILPMPEPRVQRQPEMEEEEEEVLQTTPLAQRQVEPEEEEEEEVLQAKQLPGQTSDVTPDVDARINAIRSSGQFIPESVRAFFESRFGYNFSHVRIHTDAQADILNRKLNARAFTVSQDIFFRQGAYSPGSLSGRELLAHELTQQLSTKQFIARQVTGVPAAPHVNAVVQNVWNAHPGIHAVQRLLQPKTEDHSKKTQKPNKGWWSKHRLLKKGTQGPDVGKVQYWLKVKWGIPVNINNKYDDDTFDAVKQFQKIAGLDDDGIVGPFTHASLFESNYRYNLTKPPIVQQTLYACWAAAFESALPSWSGRGVPNVDSLQSYYASFLEPTGITPEGLRQVAKDYNANGWTGNASDFRIETIKRLLLTTKSHLILVHGIGGQGTVAHTEVIYGFGVRKGLPYLSVMDPSLGSYSEIDLDLLQGVGQEIIIIFPN